MSELVGLHEARAQVGAFGLILLPEPRDAAAGRVDLRLYGAHVSLRLLQLFGAKLAFDFELAQVAEQRPLFRRETIGFALKGLEPLAGALRERFGARVVRLLRRDRDTDRERDEDDAVAPAVGHRVRRGGERL